ncbi:hypothetical protein M2128_001481 [Polynucleobacter sphagniphilus]|jgi:hypothetical protein|nr:hypothetical protein [Polynucleobacter sphagniphilus]MDH6155395.1 hypothetical protein [Polynucleobacter sphagniphilus]MDH6240795.1 hypothetical protein [Polynucleobacter sphagniphilus]MDH6249709.1 hypothetical protein [Polynucleobacter sphagniphilus]MDH6302547.1 hypothetical protein [Polynucleobacter sphagniphilus]
MIYKKYPSNLFEKTYRGQKPDFSIVKGGFTQ